MTRSRSSRRSSWPLSLALGVTVALALIATSRWIALTLLVVGAGLMTQGRLLSPAFASRLDAGLGRFGQSVAQVVSGSLLAVVYVVVFIPVSALSRIRHSPLGRPRGSGVGGWLDRRAHSNPPVATHSFGRELRAPARPGGALLRVVGALAVLAAIDLAVGTALDVTQVLPSQRGDLLRGHEAQFAVDLESPAFQEPWAEEYADELIQLWARTDGEYQPYLMWGPVAFHGRYVNSDGRERRSYEPPIEPGVTPLRIGFFGGSTMFGHGQRDLHTIPSEFARIAEREGVPVEVHNYGVPAWVSWQEYLYLERLLGDGEDFDLIVFYDGFNEILAQGSGPSSDPTHMGRQVFQQFAEDYHRENLTPGGWSDGVREMATAYGRSSIVARVLGIGSGASSGGEPGADDGATPEQRLDAALAVYARSVARVLDLTRLAGPPARFFWQPQPGGWAPETLSQLPEATIDISGSLDGAPDPVYLDVIHTNEKGARLVAAAMWEHLAPVLRSADRPVPSGAGDS